MRNTTDILERMVTLNKMDCLIRDYGDENYWMDWIEVGVPDGGRISDLEDIAKDDKMYLEVMNDFWRIVDEIVDNEDASEEINELLKKYFGDER